MSISPKFILCSDVVALSSAKRPSCQRRDMFPGLVIRMDLNTIMAIVMDERGRRTSHDFSPTSHSQMWRSLVWRSGKGAVQRESRGRKTIGFFFWKGHVLVGSGCCKKMSW